MKRIKITEDEAYEMYDEMIDEVTGTVRVAGIEFIASKVLRNTDPIAYRVGFSDYLDSIRDEYLLEGWND